MTSPLDPPRPVPKSLWPQRDAPHLPDDLLLVPSTSELRAIARALDRDHVAGFCRVVQRDGSPWIECDIAVPFDREAREHLRVELADEWLAPPGIYRYAIWRYTGSVYRVDEHGAVPDDPIEFD